AAPGADAATPAAAAAAAAPAEAAPAAAVEGAGVPFGELLCGGDPLLGLLHQRQRPLRVAAGEVGGLPGEAGGLGQAGTCLAAHGTATGADELRDRPDTRVDGVQPVGQLHAGAVLPLLGLPGGGEHGVERILGGGEALERGQRVAALPGLVALLDGAAGLDHTR